MFMENNVDCH